jgi:biotin carboxylase
LAFAYHPRSFGTFEVAKAAEGVCRLVWVVDTGMPEVDSMSRLLRRLGDLVDVAGMSVDDAAASIATSRPDGLLALHDSLLPWTARVAEQLELPFIAPGVAESLADKYAQRTALRAGGLAVPGFWRIPGVDDVQAWADLAAQASFPALLKPRIGLGSHDVVRVQSMDELQLRLADLRGESDSQPGRLLLEEYLHDRPSDEGRDFAGYVSVESIVSDGHASHLAITGRFPPTEPFRETGFFIPSALDDADRRDVLDTAGAAIAALGVTHGCLHTEIKLTPQGPRVIELNGRMGGGTPDMLAAVTDIDLMAIAMRLALGERIVFDDMPHWKGVVYVLYAHAPTSMHRILAVDGLDRLRSNPSVDRVMLNRGPGHNVDWREGNWGHVFSVHGVVADHAELATLARHIDAETRISGQ